MLPAGSVKPFILPAVVLGALLVRLPSLFQDPWFDEIWSIFLSVGADSVVDIFLNLKHDNNHILNSVYLHLAGYPRDFYVYRIHSLLAGVLSVAVIGRVLPPVSGLESGIRTLLFGFSFLLIVYSSEARGYSLCILFSLSSLYSMEKYQSTLRLRDGFLFFAFSVLAMLSHFSYLYIFASILVYVAYGHWAGGPRTQSTIRLLAPLILVTLFLALLYFVHIRHLAVGGANEAQWQDAVLGFFRLFVGFDDHPVATLCMVGVFLGVAIAEGLFLYREDKGRLLFLLSAVILMPGLIIMVSGYEYPQSRYFVLTLPFWIILFSSFLARMYRRGKGSGYLATALLASYLVSSAGHLHRHHAYGKGGYLASLNHIAGHSEADPVVVSSDHHFRNNMLVQFYLPYLERGKSLRYASSSESAGRAPDWIIMHSFTRERERWDRISTDSGQGYVLSHESAAAFPGIWGWNWHAYKRLDAESGKN